MPFAVGIFFDPKSENAIRGIWDELCSRGVCSSILNSGGKPHITLAIFNEINHLEDFLRRLKEFSEKRKSFSVRLGSIGTFPGNDGVVFLAPSISEELLSLHREIQNLFVDMEDLQWQYYMPSLWVPHCTVAVKIPQKLVPKAIEVLLEIFQPIVGTIDEIALVEFKPVNYVASYKLG